MSRQPPPGQLPGQLNIFQAAESMGAAEALRQAADALTAAAAALDNAADVTACSPADDEPMRELLAGLARAQTSAASAARTAANQARQEADR